MSTREGWDMVHGLRGWCACNTLVWQGARPSVWESVLCPKCGADCSIAPTLVFRLRLASYQLRRWLSVYLGPCYRCTTGWATPAVRLKYPPPLRRVLRLRCVFRDGRTPINLFRLPRERERRKCN